MGQGLAAECVYTIVHPTLLSTAAREGGSKRFTERKVWAKGLQLLRQAESEGLELPILLGDATDCSRLLYWGILKKIELDGKLTHYTVDRVRRLPHLHAPQELVLLSTGKNIAPDFIRPYALCQTPQFIHADSLAA